jgi:hypothetical protein
VRWQLQRELGESPTSRRRPESAFLGQDLENKEAEEWNIGVKYLGRVSGTASRRI